MKLAFTFLSGVLLGFVTGLFVAVVVYEDAAPRQLG